MPTTSPGDLLDSRIDDEELLADLLGLYFDTVEERLGRLRIAVESADVDTIRSTANMLRGSSEVIGADRIAGVCRDLEQCSDRTAGADAALDELRSLVDHLRDSVAEIPGVNLPSR